jgi:hypothetical protein
MAHPGGRPTIYSEAIVNKSDFKNESDFCVFLEKNIKNICRDIFNDEYVSHVREFQIGSNSRRFRTKAQSLDFFVSTKTKNIAIECKVQKKLDINKSSSCLSQLLGYGTRHHFDELYIFADKIHPLAQQIIEKYNLPIRIVVLNKTYYGIFN